MWIFILWLHCKSFNIEVHYTSKVQTEKKNLIGHIKGKKELIWRKGCYKEAVWVSFQEG